VAPPKPVPGLVVRYAYLWSEEQRKGRVEGVKDRPCAVVLTIHEESGADVVGVLPITHSPPNDSDTAIEIPLRAKARLGLDSDRSWIVLTEMNMFTWPGFDLRPAKRGDIGSAIYGGLPRKFFRQVRDRFARILRDRKAQILRRD